MVLLFVLIPLCRNQEQSIRNHTGQTKDEKEDVTIYGSIGNLVKSCMSHVRRF